MASESRPYHPQDAISTTLRATMVTTGAGALVAGVQNTLAKQNIGAMGVLTRSGGTIAVYAAMGASYAFAKTASANLREKNDSLNSAIGGFFAGSMMGLKIRSTPAIIGYGACLAVILGTFDYAGGSLTGYTEGPEVDQVAKKEFLRKNRRIPVEQTIAELGEGRGIYGAGYEERRRERLREKYGVDFTGVPSSH
ncbi:uncharacterized protein BDZ99DRAFT_436772 [Mytilinidion resinicola]|uniref:NADH-ubiquinone oxidoreductase 213 kDa subunit n=1 Tax=Mytilinidion resinicola TaxID=574789 RepID=A0A6A6YZT4_9PEZI|nr:uncharacterized protein BDZ99DRAFT_436772 [Mytilinidion resinicola]KAF2814048.1 hypothetical protein BDZ99DRAFT_436772 [Mytilinidion resinicola]